jgi:hypothetical protein
MITKQILDKQIPWKQYLDYLSVHHDLIEQYIIMNNKKEMKPEEMQHFLPDSFN